MPKTKRVYRKKRATKKRTYKRKTYIPSYPTDKTRLMKHRYHATLAQAPSTTFSIATSAMMRANDMYVPENVTTHQPLYFDQMADLFNHFVVLGSKMTINFTGHGLTTDQNIAIVPTDRTGVVFSSDNYLEQVGVKAHILSAEYDRPVKLTNTFSRKKVYRRPINSTDLGTGTSSPTELYYYQIVTSPVMTLANSGTIRMDMYIDYIALWSERRIILGS